MPTAAKLMTSDEPPADDERQRDAGDRDQHRPRPPMLMNAWTQSQRGDAGREQRPERVGRAERRPDAQVAEDEEQHDHEPGAEQPELLADDREDEVVRRVGQEQPAREAALAKARARRCRRAPSARKPWTLWKPSPERRPTGRARPLMRSIW